ncbi:TPA: hypothetical protein OOF55_002723 [Morganella morganii]|nr:hypothetical protein [Morganella morganii]
MSNNSTDAMKQSKFIITAQPVCFIRPVTTLTNQIDIARRPTNEFSEPVFATISDDDIRLTDEYIAELQAQGVDKLADAIQDIYDGLLEHSYSGNIIATLLSEIGRCRTFASRLRNPSALLHSYSCVSGTNALCDNCSDQFRGGCMSAGSQYPWGE